MENLRETYENVEAKNSRGRERGLRAAGLDKGAEERARRGAEERRGGYLRQDRNSQMTDPELKRASNQIQPGGGFERRSFAQK